MSDNKVILESKSTDGKFGLPNKWMAETIPMNREDAEKVLEKREFDVNIYDGMPSFIYRLVEIEEEQKPKKKKKVNKKS